MSTMDRAWSALAKGRASGALSLLLVILGSIPLLILAFERHARGVALFASDRWDVDTDRSYIEILGYALVLGAAALLLSLSWQRSVLVYGGWAVALVVLAGDDAFQGHEEAGGWLYRNYPGLDPPGLRPQDVGELLAWAALGAGLSGLVYVTHRRSSLDARQDSRVLVQLIGLLMVFAVGLDMFHIALKTVLDAHPLNLAIISVEAAGEVAAMAVIFAYTVHMARRKDEPDHAARPSCREARPRAG